MIKTPEMLIIHEVIKDINSLTAQLSAYYYFMQIQEMNMVKNKHLSEMQQKNIIAYEGSIIKAESILNNLQNNRFFKMYKEASYE